MNEMQEESLFWIDQVETLRALGPTASRFARKNAIKLSDGQVTIFINLEACFDPAAIEKIRSAAKGADSHKESAQPKLGPQPEASAQGTLPYLLSSNKAKAFIGLKKSKVPNLSGAVHAVLDIAISRRLTPKQIEALVEHIVSGKLPQDFDPLQVKRKTRRDKKKPETPTEEVDENSQPEAPVGGNGTSAQGNDLLKGVKKFWKWVKPGIHEVFGWYHGFFKKLANFIVPHPSSHSSGNRRISTLPALRSQKGVGGDKPLQALVHWAVYVILQLFFWDMILGLIPRLKPWLEWPVRWLAHQGLVVFPAAAWAYAQSHLVPAIFIGVLLALALAAAYAKKPAQTLALIAVLGLAWFYGRIWSDDLKLPTFFSAPNVTASAPVVAAVPEEPAHTNSNSTKRKDTTVLRPQAEGQALGVPINNNGVAEIGTMPTSNNSENEGRYAPIPFSGIGDGKTLLGQAISTIINNSYVKSFPVTPDSSIGQLMAVNRVDDIAVESEYSLRVGQDGQKIMSVTPSATGLTIVTEGGLPLGGFFGGGSSFGFYWEDVQTIWCMELDTPSGKTSVLRPQAEGQDLSVPINNNGVKEISTMPTSDNSNNEGRYVPIPQKGIGIYYFVLTATNLNQPLVVRCNTANNLNHLVSAFEYFIKAAQGKYVPVTGMPYLNQGMVLGDQGKVTALWANSPADQAGLTFADHVWSVQGNQEQKGAALESALQSLPSGKQTINVVTPADWQAAAAKENQAHNGVFQPKLTAMEIVVP